MFHRSNLPRQTLTTPHCQSLEWQTCTTCIPSAPCSRHGVSVTGRGSGLGWARLTHSVCPFPGHLTGGLVNHASQLQPLTDAAEITRRSYGLACPQACVNGRLHILLIDMLWRTRGLRSHPTRAELQADGFPEPGGEVPGSPREPFMVTDVLPPTARGADGRASRPSSVCARELFPAVTLP